MPKSDKSKPERNPVRVLTFNADQPAAPTTAKSSMDALADAIRKNWLQNKMKAA